MLLDDGALTAGGAAARGCSGPSRLNSWERDSRWRGPTRKRLKALTIYWNIPDAKYSP
jgi:hypothetical protein